MTNNHWFWGVVLVLALTVSSSDAENKKPSLPTIQTVIPKDTQWTIGYDAVIGTKKGDATTSGRRSKNTTNNNHRKPSAKAAAKPPPPPPPVMKTANAVAKTKKQKDAITVESSDPAALVRAVIGVAIAATAAAVGGAALANLDNKALMEAIPKPVVPVNLKFPTPPLGRKINNPNGASIPNEIFNLVKAIVGVGVLSLPAGVAAFGDAPSAFIPAGILITVIGMLSAYGFALIGKVCAYTGAKSYREAWSKTVGPSTSWIPAWSTTSKTFLACLAFSMVLADTFSTLLNTERTLTLAGVTIGILLPLCLMKNLKSLAPFSLVGVLGMAYTAFAMTVRWLDGNYKLPVVGNHGLEGEGAGAGVVSGLLVNELSKHLKPKFGNKGISSVFHPSSLILVCMLSTAYMVR